MKSFFLIVIFAIVLLVFVVPQFFLDKAYAMDRSTTIAGPPAAIQSVIGDLRTWDDWTVWNKEADPTLERTFEGDPGTVGHKMTWTGEELGEGEITITAATDTRIDYDMVFDGSDPAKCALVLSPQADGTTGIKWEMSGEFDGMAWQRWLGLMMDGMVGPAFEEGLANLKARIEGKTGDEGTGEAPQADPANEPAGDGE